MMDKKTRNLFLMFVVLLTITIMVIIAGNIRPCVSAEKSSDGYYLGDGATIYYDSDIDVYYYDDGHSIIASETHSETFLCDLRIDFGQFSITINRGNEIAAYSNAPSALQVLLGFNGRRWL